MKQPDVIPLELAQKLKGFGFIKPTLSYYLGIHLNHPGNWCPQNHNIKPLRTSAPTFAETVDWLDEQGYFIEINPEYYQDGINWVWQIMWYTPKSEWLEDKEYQTTEWKISEHVIIPASNFRLSFEERCMAGTALYGDNHEYPTRPEAVRAAVALALEIYTGKKEIEI